MASFSSNAWLLQGLVHSIPGRLKLQGDTLSFVALGIGTMGKRNLSKLEEKTNIPDLRAQLNTKQQVILWSVKVQELEKVQFPLLYFSAGVHFTFNHQRYRISFIQPQNTYARETTENAGLNSIQRARHLGQQWKAIFQDLLHKSN